jgi:hypothetical protein
MKIYRKRRDGRGVVEEKGRKVGEGVEGWGRNRAAVAAAAAAASAEAA